MVLVNDVFSVNLFQLFYYFSFNNYKIEFNIKQKVRLFLLMKIIYI